MCRYVGPRGTLRNPHLSSDRGSIPMALLGAIIAGGIIVALTASVFQGQRSARFDRSYTTAVQGADAGVQEAADQIIRGVIDPNRTAAVGTVETGTNTFNAGTSTETTYEWTAEKTSPMLWDITSTGTIESSGEPVSRTVEAQVRDLPRFFLAAFADTSLELRGSNGADSYNGSSWLTGNGVLGTNGDVNLNGSSTSVDAVHLYNWDNYPDFSRCVHTGGSDCDDVLNNNPSVNNGEAIAPSMRIGYKLEVSRPQFDVQFIRDQLAACGGGPFPSYTTSVDGSVLGTAGATTVKCVENLHFDTDTTVAGPIEFYVNGEVSTANHTGSDDLQINCSGCVPGSSAPDSKNLTIYSVGPRVIIGNHNSIGAGIFAPLAECVGNGSNAQTQVYGSMTCDSIANQGGWKFHFDDRLTSIGTGQWELDSWREE